jgi:outer membrane immunogenic protein
MRKTLLLFLLLPFMAVASQAQESRQDISLSVTGIFPPFITGNDVQQTGTYGLGGLVSYRYMLTPRSGLELNYQYGQNAQKYYTSFNNVRVHDRMQEISEYRGLLMKTPNFGLEPQKTGRFYNVYNPVIGIAYHF